MRALLQKISTPARWGALLLGGLALAACASTAPAPAPTTIRSSALTAPADLQLLCAGEAANRFGAPAGSTLPIGSRAGADGTFAVDVKLPSGQALCIIDANGGIVSLVRV